MLDEPWTLSPAVALRPEPFGALAYHFGNRKLSFLKRPELVTVVRGLGDHADVRAALTREVKRLRNCKGQGCLGLSVRP